VIRVLLDVSSPALRAGLQALLSSDKTIRVIALPNSLDDDSEADVVIASASRASLLNQNLAESPSAAVLLLGDEPLNVRELRRSFRVWGVLPSDASSDEIGAAVHALSQGLIVGASALLFESESEPLSEGPLTERESEVLGLLSKGLANKQIAVQLGISEHTVKFHVSSIYTKLNVTNRTEAMRAGLREGWIAL
jgi:DNA-binding NarL/FixJ family response regulator